MMYFDRPLGVTQLATDLWATLWPVRFVVVLPGAWRYTKVVPVGFVTDLASIPRIFRPFFSPSGRYALAAVMHDWLYRCNVTIYGFPRAYADLAFLFAMRVLGVSPVKRWMVYNGVRIGGRFAIEKHARNLAAGKPTVLLLDVKAWTTPRIFTGSERWADYVKLEIPRNGRRSIQW